MATWSALADVKESVPRLSPSWPGALYNHDSEIITQIIRIELTTVSVCA